MCQSSSIFSIFPSINRSNILAVFELKCAPSTVWINLIFFANKSLLLGKTVMIIASTILVKNSISNYMLTISTFKIVQIPYILSKYKDSIGSFSVLFKARNIIPYKRNKHFFDKKNLLESAWHGIVSIPGNLSVYIPCFPLSSTSSLFIYIN